MNIMLGIAISGAVVLSVAGLATSASRIDHKSEQRAAAAEVDRYRMFMFVADQAMRAAPVVSAPTVRTWDGLRTSAHAPPGAQQAGMPAGWKVVQMPGAGWVACTEMSERGIGMLAQLAPRAAQAGEAGASSATGPVALALGAGPKVTHMVLAAPGSAASLAGLCG